MRFTKRLLMKCAMAVGLVVVGGCASEGPYDGGFAARDLYGYGPHERPPLSEFMPDHWQREQDQRDRTWQAFGHY